MAYDFANVPVSHNPNATSGWTNPDFDDIMGDSSADNAYAHRAEAHERDTHWQRTEDEFTTAGYREGITAGKESALQEGFDAGFAGVGVPLGHELGLLRGRAAAMVGWLRVANKVPAASGTGDAGSSGLLSSALDPAALLAEAQSISTLLAEVRFSDIVLRDLEAEAHAREHLDAAGMSEGMELSDIVDSEELRDRRDAEMLEDMMGAMSAGGNDGKAKKTKRPTVEDVQRLKERLDELCGRVGVTTYSS